MKDDEFDVAYYYMLGNEGGFVNHYADKGGATKAGVSLNFLRQMFEKGSRWVDINNDNQINEEDILLLSYQQVKNIYREQFWKPVKDLKPFRLAVKVFDMGVHLGVGKAIQLLQRSLGIQEDGIIGPITKTAIDKNKDDLFKNLVKELKKYYIAIVNKDESQKVFLDGWLKRAMKLP